MILSPKVVIHACQIPETDVYHIPRDLDLCLPSGKPPISVESSTSTCARPRAAAVTHNSFTHKSMSKQFDLLHIWGGRQSQAFKGYVDKDE
eukprot:6204952-Pleurochrysis_carterae.AAC.1